MQLANRAIYLCDNRYPINQGHAFFLAFHFELTPFSDGQLSKNSARATVFTGKYLKVVYQYRPTNKSLVFAILPGLSPSIESRFVVPGTLTFRDKGLCSHFVLSSSILPFYYSYCYCCASHPTMCRMTFNVHHSNAFPT